MTHSYLLAGSLFLLGTSHSALAADGKALYEATCIACHGAKAQGAIPGVPDLAKGGRMAKPDAELAANILNGFQSKGSPMAMPAKGGNPNLTAADANALVLYLRTLTGASALSEGTVGAVPAAARATTTAVAPVPATAAAPDMQPFARGAKAWADNCARCHGMREPKDLTDRQWKIVTTHMRLRAGLDGQQVRDITIFLQGSN